MTTKIMVRFNHLKNKYEYAKKRKKEGKDQESIQKSITPDLRHHMET